MVAKKVSTTAEDTAYLAEARLNEAKADQTRISIEEARKDAAVSELNRAANAAAYKQKAEYDFNRGYFEFDDDVNSLSVGSLLGSLRVYSRLYPKADITIEMNTGGGSIIEGFRLFDELLRFRKEGHFITIRVRGMAASMGAVILQAASKREVGPSAFVMIHRAAFGAMGKAYEIEDELEFVKMLEARIKDIFADASGRPASDFDTLFTARKDQWFSAKQSLQAGLADSII